MQSFTMFVSLMLGLTLWPAPRWQNSSGVPANPKQATRTEGLAKQLLAVRGEVVKKEAYSKGWVRLTIKSLRDNTEVAVLARETDLVGSAVNRSGDKELLNLLSENSHDNESITAAELDEGDLVSIIYDPQQQNRALEIYIH
jgi:hypothetical protein